jgi:Cd2+/Zn2+-exporting ATPase
MKLSKKRRVFLDSAGILVSFILYKTLGYHWLSILFMLLTTALAGFPIIKKAWGALRAKIIGIDTLVTIAMIGAILLGEYWEAAAVSYLFLLGDYLESKTIEKTRSALKVLIDSRPVTARVLMDGVESIRPSEKVQIKDKVLVKPGEKIPVDGTIVEGNAFVNQAPITGESIPLEKREKDFVFSGTILESGYMVIEAEKVGEDTTFSRILSMVEEAQDKKAKAQKFIERFSKYYTPGIIVLAVLLYIFTKDIELALTLLVISCPGALVISTPVSIVAGIGNGAKKGILFKGGEIIEGLAKAKVFAFDKTGTLTRGKPVVNRIQTFGISEEEMLKIAWAGEVYSEHPLAKAIIEKAKSVLGSQTEVSEEVRIIPGQGVSFTLAGIQYFLGNRKLFQSTSSISIFQENQINAEEALGQSVILVGNKTTLLGIISIADAIREEAKSTILTLKALGIKKNVMLTGDNTPVAKAISEKLGMDAFYALLLPEEKVKIVKELEKEYGTVIFVGDGVNDAPALASATLGIAVGGAGKDIAMETADIVLMSEDIQKLSYALKLSKATVRNMKQNLWFALLVVGLLLLGVLVKTVNLSLGMLVHEGSVLLVIINAVRLLSFENKSKNNVSRTEKKGQNDIIK